jgi:peptide/nickel transport system permease protein
MLNAGRIFMRTAPHMTVFPGLAIMLTVLAFNFLGDGLRDALDPWLNNNN